MVMAEVLQVESRELLGKQNNRRLRNGGKLPAVLYGHGKKPVNLSLLEDQFIASLRHGAKVVELSGVEQGQALLQEVQWDTFLQNVLHVDLLRVEIGDRIKVDIPLVLRGDAPGTHEGGVVEQLLRTVELETSPALVPENLHLSINGLKLGDSLAVRDIDDVPEGATLLVDVSQPCVHCYMPMAEPEETEAEMVGSSEPEIIGRTSEDESDDSPGK
jgi:large subunit ribosomal protein L25